MSTKTKYPNYIIEQCRALYVQGFSPSDISRDKEIPLTNIFRWKKQYKWTCLQVINPVEQTLAKRLNQLALRDKKTDKEIEEFLGLCEKFGNLKIKLAQAELLKTGNVASPENISNYEEKPKKPKTITPRVRYKIKNNVSEITEEMVMEVLKTVFYSYQLVWWAAMKNPDTRRNRFILKSRQIGATYYFAFEALADAILTGDNQIFMSASRAQAEVFKAYIIAFAMEHFEVELKGAELLKLSNGAELRFLSTNANTAQSYHGHLYRDEVFWIQNFEKLEKVSSGMASHSKWRRTDFSTPSAISHQAYKKWSGQKYNEKRAESEQVDFNITHAKLKNGHLGADNIWRYMLTVKDAEAQGCKLFDIEELQTEYSKDDFNNLFMCKFIDDVKSVFTLGIMMTCYVSKDYADYDDKATHPFDNKPVAIGYDPSRTRDNSSLAILAIPLRPTDKWRVLKTLDYHGQNFQYQANRIKDIVETHNVQHIGIDVTGLGYGVYELVQEFYRRVTPINYSNDTKTSLVMKAIDVIENGRFEYQSGNKTITQAFMMISKTTTNSGMITYASNRNNEAGHADVAWSIMHALMYEPIAVNRKTTTVTFGN